MLPSLQTLVFFLAVFSKIADAGKEYLLAKTLSTSVKTGGPTPAPLPGFRGKVEYVPYDLKRAPPDPGFARILVEDEFWGLTTVDVNTRVDRKTGGDTALTEGKFDPWVLIVRQPTARPLLSPGLTSRTLHSQLPLRPS